MKEKLHVTIGFWQNIRKSFCSRYVGLLKFKQQMQTIWCCKCIYYRNWWLRLHKVNRRLWLFNRHLLNIFKKINNIIKTKFTVPKVCWFCLKTVNLELMSKFKGWKFSNISVYITLYDFAFCLRSWIASFLTSTVKNFMDHKLWCNYINSKLRWINEQICEQLFCTTGRYFLFCD